MFGPVTKAARILGQASEIADAVLECGATALAAPSGPVYLGIPTDLLSEGVTAEPDSTAARPAPRPPAAPAPQASPDADLDHAADLLAAAQRPLIWAGGGALRAQAGPAVGELAERLAAPVITTYMGRGLLPPDHPCTVFGPVHAPEVGALWDEADVVVAIGSDLDGVMTQNWLMPQPPTLLAINLDAADAGKNYTPELTLLGDARAVLERLAPRIPAGHGALQPLRARLAEIEQRVIAAVGADEPQALEFLDTLESVLPAETIVVVDMCIPGYWVGGYRRVPAPRKLAYPLGWGTLGFGFPASLGAALAGTGPTVCVCGDGGFLFACGELATVAEAEIPVTIVLVDDGGYGMLRYDQARVGDRPFGVDLVRPDFAALAASFGLPATTVSGFGPEFEGALGNAMDHARAEMIVVNAALKPPVTTSPRWYRR
jgi:acetolactate synthase-1/2/3 large subunit